MFPSPDDCAKANAELRDALHDFDLTLREATIRAQLHAADGGLDKSAFEAACVTVLLTLAADAALQAGAPRNTLSQTSFETAARQAFEWAMERRLGRDSAESA